MNDTADNSDTVYAVGHYAPKVLRNLNSQRLKNQLSDVGLVVGNTIIRSIDPSRSGMTNDGSIDHEFHESHGHRFLKMELLERIYLQKPEKIH